jgi:tRNA (cmo5U34)-methyltransferase
MSSPSPYSDPDVVARYAEGPPRLVPGFADLHRMTAILLAERAPEQARILVIGAGGGLELKALAELHPRWTFDGVDPAAEMLELARQTLGPLSSRVELHAGTIDAAPPGPFDGATCLLTMHFIPTEERTRTVSEIRRRLRPGAPLVVAHFSFPQAEGERALWLTRYAAFGIASGIEPDQARSAAAAIDARLTILTPEQDEAVLREAGFTNVSQFYAGLAFRGWVAYA